jgi:hypothetical protein
MNITAAKGLFFIQHSWLFFAGRDEDGTDIHHEGYCVQAEDSKGYRWNHNKVFLLSDFIKKAEGDTTKAREILEQTMNVLFDKMKSHVDNGGKLNEYLWEEDEPCYGSDAYCEAYGC